MKTRKEKKDLWIEVPGWLFLILLILGIWIEEYRWRLIFTSFVSILIAMVNTYVKDKRNEITLKTKQNSKVLKGVKP